MVLTMPALGSESEVQRYRLRSILYALIVVALSAAVALGVVVMTGVLQRDAPVRFFLHIIQMLRNVNPADVFLPGDNFYFPYYRTEPLPAETLLTELAAMFHIYFPVSFILLVPLMWVSNRYSFLRLSLMSTLSSLIPLAAMMVLVSAESGQYISSVVGLTTHVLLKLIGFTLGSLGAHSVVRRLGTKVSFLVLLFVIAAAGVVALFLVYSTIPRLEESLGLAALALGPMSILLLTVSIVQEPDMTKRWFWTSMITGLLLLVYNGLTVGSIWILSLSHGEPWQYLITNDFLRLWLVSSIGIIVLVSAMLAVTAKSSLRNEAVLSAL